MVSAVDGRTGGVAEQAAAEEPPLSTRARAFCRALEALVDIAEWAHAVLSNTTPPTTTHDNADTEEPCPVLDEWYR